MSSPSSAAVRRVVVGRPRGRHAASRTRRGRHARPSTPIAQRARTVTAVAVAAGLPVTAALPAPAVAQTSGYEQRIDLTFPVVGPASFVDTYHASRGGGTRIHEGTDVFGAKHQRIVAVRAGTACHVSGLDRPMPSYGYMVTVCGDDGREYHYIHLNNDTPGTDDGRGGPGNAYAPGIRPGVRVARGQWIGYLGDSGNAESTPPHLHFEIEDPGLRDARVSGGLYRGNRINPFPSLAAAAGGSGRVRSGATGGVRLGARGPEVASWQADLRTTGARIAADGVFGPATHVATVAFQRAQGLTPDGVVGPATRGAMGRARGGGATSRSASPLASSATRVLRLQSPLLRGEDVRAWQQRMRDRGWAVTVDGVFGPRSADAARQFQARFGLAVDGVVGPATRARLAQPGGSTPAGAAPSAATAAPSPRRVLRLATPALRGEDVRAWQQRMRDRGWAVTVDGVFGPRSADAARQFQARFGLDVDGVVGAATWARTFGT